MLKDSLDDESLKIGVASKNLMSEFGRNLQMQKTKNIDVNHRQYNFIKKDQYLIDISKGDRVIGAKDFMLVFYITCF